jgi:hypothetical protein
VSEPGASSADEKPPERTTPEASNGRPAADLPDGAASDGPATEQAAEPALVAAEDPNQMRFF